MARSNQSAIGALVVGLTGALAASCILQFDDLTGGAGPSDGGPGGDAMGACCPNQAGGCAPCGVACAKSDCNGEPCVIAAGDAARAPWSVAVRGAHLYWTSREGDSVKRLDLATGAIVDFVPSTPSPTIIAVNTTHAVWVADDGIWACPLEGADCAVDKVLLFTAAEPDALVWSLAVDDRHAYWTQDEPSGTAGQILRCHIVNGCTPPEVAATNQSHPHGIAVDGDPDLGFIYWTIQGDGPQFGRVIRTQKGPALGEQQLHIAVNLDFPESLALTATDVYWTKDPMTADPGGVFRCPSGTDSCVPDPVVNPLAQPRSRPIRNPVGIATDGVSVYWTNSGSTTVMACPAPHCEGPPAVIAMDQTNPRGITIDETCVYWTDQKDGGRILRIAK